MKILFLSAYPGFTGSQRIALQLALAARDAGHEVLAVAPGEMEFLERAAAVNLATGILPVPEKFQKFGKTLLGGSFWSKLRFLDLFPHSLRSARLLRKWRVDGIYAAEERAVVQIGPAARLVGIPLLWHIQGGLLSGSSWIYKVIDRLSSYRVCVSEAVADTVVEVLGSASRDRLRVIHNGVPDLESDKAERSDDANGGGNFRLLFAGSVVPEKGVHHLILSVAEMKGHSVQPILSIAGSPRDENYLRYLEHLIEKNHLEDRIKFLGFRDDLPDLIRSSDLVVCPSIEREHLATSFGDWDVDWKEGFCLVALEAMRASKAVVASDSYGLKEVVVDGETGVRLPPGEPSRLAEAIVELAGDRETLARLGANGRKRFLEKFSLESMTQAFLEEFETVFKC